MKAHETFKRVSALSGIACAAMFLGGLLVTRHLPPWVPYSTMASGRR
jgi:hypothetical protein